MATVRKTITLSDTQDIWIKAQIARGAFTNHSDYISDLVRRDQEEQGKLADLRQVMNQGIESGLSERSLDDIWAEGETRAKRGLADAETGRIVPAEDVHADIAAKHGWASCRRG